MAPLKQPATTTPTEPVTGAADAPPTDEQARLLRLADGHGYFLAAKGTAMDLDWMLLERAGWAREFRDGITIRTWCVTDAGRAALGGAVPEKPAVHP